MKTSQYKALQALYDYTQNEGKDIFDQRCYFNQVGGGCLAGLAVIQDPSIPRIDPSNDVNTTSIPEYAYPRNYFAKRFGLTTLEQRLLTDTEATKDLHEHCLNKLKLGLTLPNTREHSENNQYLTVITKDTPTRGLSRPVWYRTHYLNGFIHLNIEYTYKVPPTHQNAIDLFFKGAPKTITYSVSTL